jgi:DNA-directed RNA polymerase
MNQQDLELRMYFGGIDRAHTTMEKAESKSRADSCPYARALQQEFVLPVSEAIEKEVANSMAGAYATHKSLLKGLDYDGVATIAVRTALNSCMSNVENVHERLIGNALGKAVHSELVLAQLAEANPRLYYTLAGDLNRRMSKNVEHKVNGLRAQAKAAGVEFTEWPVGAREKVGAYLLGVLIRAGLLTMEDRVIKFGKTQYRGVFLAEPVKEKISRIKYYVAVTNPTYGPCVEPPLDWTTPTDGGFHTQKLRSARRYGVVQATSSAAEHMQTIGQDEQLGE